MARKRRGRNEGSIYFREADQRWVGNISLGYDAQGKRVRRVVYGATKKEVQDELRKLQNEAGTGASADAHKLTVGDFLDSWVEHVKGKVQPNTWVPYDRHVRLHLKPRIGGLKLSKLTPFNVQQLYAQMEREGVSAPLARKVGTTLGTALRHACRVNLLTFNAAREVAKPQAIKPEISVWDAGQVGKFLDAAREDRLHALYPLAIDSGMRQGELLALHWPDVDFTGSAVSVRQSLEEIDWVLRLKVPKTKKSRRRIELTPTTMAALHEHRKAMLVEGHDVKTGPVFVDAQGQLLHKETVVDCSFEKIVKRAEVPRIEFKGMRHTCATLLLMAGVNPKVVSERLGHSTIQITLDTYSHVLPGLQSIATSALAGILGRKTGSS